MLEGLEIVEVQLSYVKSENKYFRVDESYFNKKSISILKTLENKPTKKLIDLSNLITDFGAFSQMNFVNYHDQGLPFLRNQDVKENIIDSSNSVFIDNETYSKLSLKLEEHDILIPRAGTLGNAAVVKNSILPATANQNLAQIKPNMSLVKPYFLSTFLCCKFGFSQIDRVSTGNVQQWLNLENINNIKIPIFDLIFQTKIENIVLCGHEELEKSKQTYNQAENLLLEEIGLKDFTPSNEAVNIKSFKESFQTSGRLDAEYYQPKYELIEGKIKSYQNGFKKLESFIDNFSTGYPYKSDTYLNNNGIPLIRINNIKKGELDISNAINIPNSDKNLSPKDITAENDILISMSGTIGNSCKIPKGIKAVINQRIMRITTKNYNSDVLTLIINSLIGKLQLDRIGTGGVQTNISSNDIRNILIPIINHDEQQKIASLIEESFTLKEKSEKLLEVAKTAVEIAIEQNEAEALKYIEANS